MKTKQLLTLFLFLSFSFESYSQASLFYDFKVKTLDGQDFNFSSLKGKKVMVVNTASKCGFTPQYKELQELSEEFGDRLIIIGFPANNFANQEPGSDTEIREFCTKNYGVTFPMMEKISVRGDDIHPVYQWLTSKAKNGNVDSEVKWNFQKYLIDERGRLIDVAYSKEKPYSEKIIAWLTEE
jgi:glutathione peroxidase